jgi:integrase
MAAEIHTKRGRDALPVRRDPHWGAPIVPRGVVGYRKLAAGPGSWIARTWDEERGGYAFHALKNVTEYDEAVKAARVWFDQRAAGIDDDAPTVATVCREYVADLRDEQKREGAAYDAEVRFKRAVYDDSLGAIRLDKVRTRALTAWRNRVAGTPAAQDRSFRTLKAALNWAVRHRRVSPAVAIEWQSVPMHKHAERRRDLYLDIKQRRALLGACTGGTRDLVEAAALTGARPGELVALKRSDFDARTSTVTFRGKTGTRSVPLAPAAVELFKRLAKGKLPAAFMLTMDDGQPWKYPTWWAEAIREAAQRAELPKGVVLYTLRHSWITEALRAGMSTLDVARLTGTSLPMIESHYGHMVADSARERLAAVQML